VITHRHNLPKWAYQILLMGLLSSSGVIFLPILIRIIDNRLMANIMVAQVYIYYLSLITQFGFAWSGPAAMAKTSSETASLQIWRASIYSKLVLLTGPVACIFALAYYLIGDEQSYLLSFAMLLLAYALQSNWYLQAKGDFANGVGLVLTGIIGSMVLLFALLKTDLIDPDFNAYSVVLILTLPQVVLGIGSCWRVKKSVTIPYLTYISLSEITAPIIKDSPLVLGQLLVLAATTLGTPAVASLANAEITTAYAATEKLFNLGATALVGLYMAYYPTLAKSFHSDIRQYWSQIRKLLKYLLLCGALLLLALRTIGQDLLSIYLSATLAAPIQPVLVAFGIWLILCLSQHVLTGYLVFAQRNLSVLLINSLVLIVTCISGYGFAELNPLFWVYGMIAGQSIPIMVLIYLYWLDKQVT
jgi:O-antigen/teichoic acid export membrane protein